MTDLEEIKGDVKLILKIMNGNGKMGACAKLAVVWYVSLFLLVTVSGLLLRDFILR